MPPVTRALVTRASIAPVAVLLVTLAVTSAASLSAQEPATDKQTLFRSIAWQDGPKEVDIGDVAEFTIPAGCQYTDEAGAKTFLIITENPPSGREKGVLFCRPSGPQGESGDGSVQQQSAAQPWFVVFTFDPSGYVRDDDGKKLDGARILDAIRAGTAQANEVRRSRGWEVLTIDGWVRPPHYDASTHNLTWSTKATASSTGTSVNHSVRLLGRRGVLHADLVTEPDQLATTVPIFDTMIASTSFLSGHKYSEWRKGDKVAAYGLTALVAGGAGAAAVKFGLFPWLGKLVAKLGKLIFVVIAGALAGLKALFTRKKTATA